MATVTHQTAKTEYVTASSDTKYAYRRFGKPGAIPVLFLMHFRGTMDFWDHLLVNTIATERPVILFDNAGVGQSTGTVASSPAEMADHVIKFLALTNVTEVDVLGFSLGGIISPLIVANGPKGLVRKLIIAGAGLSHGPGVQSPSDEDQALVNQYAGGPSPDWDNCFSGLFFSNTQTSQAAGRAWYKRVFERNPATSGEERSKLVSDDYADGGAGLQNLLNVLGALSDPEQRKAGTYDRLAEVTIPVFVAQGKADFMIPTHNSYLLQQMLPNARLKLFPDSGHGFLYQFAEEFADDVNRFLELK
jgi:pimeloyl-ACP methyl ester carboxylesterase